MQAYLQHGKAGEPMRTEQVPRIDAPLWRHTAGVSYTPSGYGHKLPTRYMVDFEGRRYRVYSRCFSNVSSEYIRYRGEEIRVDLDNGHE